jgi:hypothetical protein
VRAVNQRYEIQGRVVEWHQGVILRDEARRAGRDSLDAAKEAAATFLADGLVTWIFEVRWEPGRATPTYTMVYRRRPTDTQSSRRSSSPRSVVGLQRERRAV